MEKPKTLERQIGIVKWQECEEYMRRHPELQEMTVASIPGKHRYAIVRDALGGLMRIHYDRLCVSCERLFLHVDGLDTQFICEECLRKK
jgi:hypothetical protein